MSRMRPKHSPLAFLQSLADSSEGSAQYETPFGRVRYFNTPASVWEILNNSDLLRTDLVKSVLGEGLLSSEGQRWKEHRRLMQPEFAKQRGAGFAATAVRSTQSALIRWRQETASSEEIDLAPELTRLTLEVIVEVFFGQELGPGGASLVEAITQLMEGLGEQANMTFNIPMTITPRGKRDFDSALGEVDAFCQGLIDRRRQQMNAGGAVPKDLLNDLMGSMTPRLDDRALRDEVVTLLISGHETTALILTWSFILLAQSPEVEANLQREVDRVLAGRPPALGDLPKLDLTTRVLQESMRLYPPVWYMVRRASVPVEIEGTSVHPGDNLLVSPYTMHRASPWWSNPTAFDPDRFAAGQGVPPRGAYIPFGAGRHTCLGQHLAMIEGVMVLATMAQAVRVRPVSDGLPSMDTTITLRPEGGLRANLEWRSESLGQQAN